MGNIAYCRIHPAIGIARVGGSKEFFIGPEVPGEVRTPPSKKYGFKDKDGQMLRQAARFRVYGYDKDGKVVGEVTPDGKTEVTWKVEVANVKAAWYDFDLAMDIPEFSGSEGTPPMKSALRNSDEKNRGKLAITPSPREISGKNTKGARYVFDDGAFYGKKVPLGELQTDAAGSLIFLPAHGKSASKDGKPAETFANNPGWHDDVADGPVTATVTIDKKNVPVEHAWVVVAPPDYAPGIIAVTTMWDVIRDAGWQLDPSIVPAEPSYQRDIMPIFARLGQNQWVNGGFGKLWGWGSPQNLQNLLKSLGDKSDFSKPLREAWFSSFRNPNFATIEESAIPPVYGDGVDFPPTNPRQWYAVTTLQYEMLRRWAKGDFIADYDPAPPPQKLSDYPVDEQPWVLDYSALDNTIGGPFHPGCEMTWPMRQPIMYDKPFRLKWRKSPEPDYGEFMTTDKVLARGGPLDGTVPGGISRWMAVPWQTDTSSCLYAYVGWQDGVFLPTFWPVRVPNNVLTEEQYEVVKDLKKPLQERRAAFSFQNRMYWLRALPPRENYRAVINEFVAKWNEVGIVTLQPGTPREDGSQVFPALMHVELGMNVKARPKLMLAAAKATMDDRSVDADRRPENLPNPRDFR
jgi:L-Lysine epsilon oxidase N-terminal/L-lysine epsilon oxidase C-terminal domain